MRKVGLCFANGIIVISATLGTAPGQHPALGPPEQGLTKTKARHARGEQAKTQQADSRVEPTAAVVPPNQTSVPNKQVDHEEENLAIQRKLEWFTGALVLAGLLQAGTMIWQARLLGKTLDEIHTQAAQMARQTRLLRRTLDTSIVTDRARLRIEIAPLNWTQM